MYLGRKLLEQTNRSTEVVCRSFVKIKWLTYTSHTLANGIKVRMTPNEDYHNITDVDELISITPKYLQSFVHSFIKMDIRNITDCMLNYTCVSNFFYDKVRLDSKMSVIVNEAKVFDVSLDATVRALGDGIEGNDSLSAHEIVTKTSLCRKFLL